ncbi:MAG TPA: serine hydrolase domain-containing protein [Verrucomicrobiae bacterium]|nr:serine hydrolase domain-containing protein [Verrucomicrobiae bacterium]
MRIDRRMLIAFLLVVGPMSLPPARAGNERLKQEIDSIFTGVTRPDDPGLALLVLKNGHVVFEKGYGVAELRTHTKIESKTNFRLASVSKQFTAMAIMLLVHDGKLRYDEKLTDVFPDFPDYGNSITIRNLLNHTSGLPDYGDLLMKQYSDTSMEKIPQIKDAGVLQLLEKQAGTSFPPGTKWEYSNSGYAVLAMVVEKVSGKSFGEFLHDRIFAPAGMKHTVAYEDGKNEVPHRAFGHTKSKQDGTFTQTDQSPTSAVLGDGGIYTSLEDMARWDNVLRKHILLSEMEMQPALTPVRLNDGSQPCWPKEPGDDPKASLRPVEYGFGWFLGAYQGHKRNYHDGGTVGFRTTIQRFVDDQWTIVVLCNRTDLNPDQLSLRVADILLPKNL